jgi:c-di-GMP-binding flagellar brake protein YcgR
MSDREYDDDRREFPRVKAPIYCRPAKRRLPRRQVVDVGLGGMRVYSDEPFNIGARFEVELFLPDGASITCLTEVVWIRSLGTDGPARYDVGLQFLDVPERTRHRLMDVLELGSQDSSNGDAET